ncbi:hypothetical protein [Pontitalea aquivivens]|uniref:hypothetical protein n=1 Tax=Pontitalea aquivivens TaxID=3388663 RepID=UPI003970C81D
MLIKVMILFLLAMAVLAMIGKLRLPGRAGKRRGKLATGRCKHCGRPRIGKTPCPCETKTSGG